MTFPKVPSGFTFICIVVVTLLSASGRVLGKDDLEVQLKEPQVWLEIAWQRAVSVKREGDDAISFMAYLGIAQCNGGDFAGALSTADDLLDKLEKAPTAECAVADRIVAAAIRASAGKPKAAKLVLDPLEKEMLALLPKPNEIRLMIAGRVQEDWAIENIAIQYARIGEFDHAMKLVEKVGIDMARADARCQLAHEMFLQHRKDEANRLLELSNQQARAAKDVEDRSQIYDEISTELADEGEYEAAFKFAEAINDSFRKMQSMHAILSAVCRGGLGDSSRKMTERIWKVIEAEPPKARFGDLEFLAHEQLFESGDLEGARRTARLAASQSSANDPEARMENDILQAIVSAAGGDIAEVRRLMSDAKSGRVDGEKAAYAIRRGWKNVADAFAIVGKFDEAMDAAALSSDNFAYLDIAEKMAGRGDLARALKAMAKSKAEGTLAGVMCRRLARGAVQHGKKVEVYEWMNSIDDAGSKAWAALGAAEGLAKGKQTLGVSNPPVMMGVGAGGN